MLEASQNKLIKEIIFLLESDELKEDELSWCWTIYKSF